MNASQPDVERGEYRPNEGPAFPGGIKVPKWYMHLPGKGRWTPNEAYDIRTGHRKTRVSNVLDRRGDGRNLQPTIQPGRVCGVSLYATCWPHCLGSLW